MNDFLGKVVTEIVNPLILLLVGAAFVVFIWGAFVFIKEAGNETERIKGRNGILWGLVGLVIIFGAYGIINIALSTFSIGTVQSILNK